MGPQGPAGPIGPPGVSAIEYIVRQASLGSQSAGTLIAPCSSGKKVISGGYAVSNDDILVHESHPTPANNGWFVQGFNHLILPGSDPLWAYAICAVVN